MKKGMIQFAAIGVTSALLFTWGLSSVNATRIAYEEPLAGITISLDKYVDHVVNQNVDLTSAVTNVAPTNELTQVPSEEIVTPEVVLPEVTEVPEERGHVVLNLNYDRLGIAKVDTYLNVRQKPNESSKILGKMTKNAGCHVYSIKKGWAKIVSGKVKGYVKADFMIFDEEAETYALEVGIHTATVNTPALMVRTLPSTDADMSSVIALDEDFEIIREELTKEWMDKFISKNISEKQLKTVNYDAVMADLSNWICISIDSDKAFVAKQYVEISYKLNRAIRIGELATDGSSGVSSGRASLVEFAKQYLGNRYVYGGTSLTGGIDCSGFAMRVFAQFGYGLPRTSGSQAAATKTISGSDAKPGDLFFYGSGGHVSHVAIYIGNGMIIHASNPATGIKISNAYYRSPIKIGRVINN